MNGGMRNPMSVYIPIWTNGISFKAYSPDQKLSYSNLREKLLLSSGDIKNKKNGWLASKPFDEWNDKKAVCFEYIKFLKNGNVSRLSGTPQYQSDGSGVIFDFESNIIMPTTSSSQKLAGMIERQSFKAIKTLTEISEYSYSGDFLYWLAYRYESEKGNISERLTINDISSIRGFNESDSFSDHVTANTNVTKYIQSQILLGMFAGLSQIHISIKSKNKNYDFHLRYDGRVIVTKPDNLETLQEKYEYAKVVHKIIQDSYSEYKSFVEKGTWTDLKKEFTYGELSTGTSSLSNLLKKLKPNKE